MMGKQGEIVKLQWIRESACFVFRLSKCSCGEIGLGYSVMLSYLHVWSSIPSTSGADSRRSKDYHVTRGAQVWELSAELWQVTAPTDCLIGVSVWDKNIYTVSLLKGLQSDGDWKDCWIHCTYWKETYVLHYLRIPSYPRTTIQEF